MVVEEGVRRKYVYNGLEKKISEVLSNKKEKNPKKDAATKLQEAVWVGAI